MLTRPTKPKIETVNDIDSYLANFWRAVKAEPDAVADLMNWPVTEPDLEARHKWLVTAARKAEHAQRMHDEPDYYDAKIAAWWCWGLCAWIGSGWCTGVWHGRGTDETKGTGINVRGEARWGKCPHLTSRGVHRQLPHLGDAGQGVHRQLPHLGNAGQGECARRGEVLREWMQALSDRLRNVRVCCGDWARICTDGAMSHARIIGVFLDPPYSAEANRDNGLYSHESGTVAHDVRAWCLERGTNPNMRLALCGYEGEHEELEAVGWNVVAWKTQGGMARFAKGKNQQGKLNKNRERIWFSPGCLQVGNLFGCQDESLADESLADESAGGMMVTDQA